MICPSTNEVISAEDAVGDVRLDQEPAWLVPRQMADLFERDRSVVSRQIRCVFVEGKLDPKSTCANFAQVQSEGGRSVTREMDHCNLDVVGQVLQDGATAEDSSVVQTEVRQLCQWVTHTLRELGLEECSPHKDRFSTLPSRRAAPFTQSTPSTKGIMARPLLNLLVEPNA